MCSKYHLVLPIDPDNPTNFRSGELLERCGLWAVQLEVGVMGRSTGVSVCVVQFLIQAVYTYTYVGMALSSMLVHEHVAADVRGLRELTALAA